MPVRIYAFAKELGLDNKQLLDICESCGIKGKGSALANLDDGEVAQIHAFIAGPPPPAPKPEPLLPEVVEPAAEEPPVEAEPVAAEPVAEAPAAETAETPPVADTPPAAKTPAAPITPPAPPKPTPPTRPLRPTGPTRKQSAPLSPNAPVRGNDLINRNTGPVRNLNQPAKKSKPDGAKKEPKPKRTGLKVKLAAMPEVKQPSPNASSGEKVQKPDIALPQDAIAKARTGAAPLEQFTKPKTAKPKKKGRGASATPSDPSTIFGHMPGKDTGKRGKGKDRDKEKKDSDGLVSPRQARQRRKPRQFSNNYSRGRRFGTRRGPVANTAAPRKTEISLQLPCTVREFSEAAGVPAVKVMLNAQQLGDESISSINSVLNDEVVELLVEQLGVEIEIRAAESLEDQVLSEFEFDDDPAKLEPRPPIVTFLGHVDHGKTSLLDAIIGIDVVSGEAGGITQHIRAYEIHKGDQKIAFVDTPGHEAFTEMRARGANVTDIAVLVVAADDGVMPQTEEAISHAKAAGVPIIVALNKIDLPGANPDKALQDLAGHELLPSEWGGDIEVVKTSAIKGEGIAELLETILVTAELHEYQSNPDRAANGTCLEAEQQSDRGVVAKFIVQGGTMKVGDVVVCGAAHGRVKAMYDTLRPSKKLKEAGPSTPVNVTGMDVAPGAGDKFYVVDDIAKAREIAASRDFAVRKQSLAGVTTKVSLEDIQARLESGDLRDPTADVITLNLIIRADVKGSIEAIQKELGKISHPEIKIRILQALVGGVTVADVRLAQASQGVIIGFNVVPDEAARSLADDVQVEVRRYDVIYKVTDDLKAMLEGRLKPEEQVVEMGMAMVLQTFSISKTGTIAGCRVMRGNIHRDCRLRLIRDSRVIGDYAIGTLKRVKDDAKEVAKGMECGIKLDGFNDIKEGDTLEAYKIEEVARTL